MPGSPCRVLRGVPILDLHDPIPKIVSDPRKATKRNPTGSSVRMLTATVDDLERLAKNSNYRADMNRPGRLQLGHTPAMGSDLAETFFPPKVGDLKNFRVEQFEGKPHLMVDMAIHESQYEQVRTYPRLSIERILGNSAKEQYISAVALLRTDPERDLPNVNYSRSTPGLAGLADLDDPRSQPMVCYGKSRPFATARVADRRTSPERRPMFNDDQTAALTAGLADLISKVVGMAGTASANYASDVAATGGDSGVVPSDSEGDDQEADPNPEADADAEIEPEAEEKVDEESAEPSETVNYADEYRRVVSLNEGLVLERDDFKQKFEAALDEKEGALVLYRRERVNSGLKDLKAEGISFNHDRLFEHCIKLATDKELDDKFAEVRANYSRVPTGDAPIGTDPPAEPEEDLNTPEHSQARADYGAANGITDAAERRRAYAAHHAEIVAQRKAKAKANPAFKP